jgi:glycosyltransferase involved in cell wall biosynthesis
VGCRAEKVEFPTPESGRPAAGQSPATGAGGIFATPTEARFLTLFGGQGDGADALHFSGLLLPPDHSTLGNPKAQALELRADWESAAPRLPPHGSAGRGADRTLPIAKIGARPSYRVMPSAAPGCARARQQRSSTELTLSVVLPNCNHAALIPRALAALLAQERPADEIIIVDDGSTDDSLRIIESWAEREPTIRCLVNPRNLGVVPSLQRGLDAAGGRYLYFAAADDWVRPGFFSLAVDRLDADPSCGFFCADAVLVDGETGRPQGFRPIARPRFGQGRVTPERAAELLTRIDNWVLTGSTVFRHVSVVQAGGFDARLGSFADGFLSRKIALSNGFFYAPVPVAVWCIFAGSASRQAALCDAEAVLRRVLPIIEADPVFPRWYPEVFRRRWRFAVARLALAGDPVDRKLIAEMGARSVSDRLALSLIWRFLPSTPGRWAILALLWLRWRPTALSRVISTALARKIGVWRRRAERARVPR